MPFRHCPLKSSANKHKASIEKNGLHAKVFLNTHDSYRGEWSNDQKHGHGTLIYHRGNYCYEGEFVRDQCDGHGRLTIQHDDGTKQRSYVGQWKRDQMNGYGTLYLSASAYYEGEFLDNQRSGAGRMFYGNGDL